MARAVWNGATLAESAETIVVEGILMAGFYLIGTILFWQFFEGRETEFALQPAGD